MLKIQTCANCDKPYDEHLIWDGNKCERGSINGWFPKSVANVIDPVAVATRPDAYRWGGTGDTLFYLKGEADKMFEEMEHKIRRLELAAIKRRDGASAWPERKETE